MGVISVRVNNEEQEVLERAAKIYNCKISSLMKRLTFERLENEYDLRIVREYEKEKEEGTLELFTFDEVMRDFAE